MGGEWGGGRGGGWELAYMAQAQQVGGALAYLLTGPLGSLAAKDSQVVLNSQTTTDHSCLPGSDAVVPCHGHEPAVPCIPTPHALHLLYVCV